MSLAPRILAFAGSTRKESFNKKLVQIGANGAKEAGADVTIIDLKDFPLPLFDEDLEAADGSPPNALAIKNLFLAHQGILISSPEYNSSITAVLKNTLDWISRPVPGEARLAAFQGKVASLLSASPGALGGLRGLVHLRAVLGNIGVIVLPDQISVPRAHEAFDGGGSLKDNKQQADVQRLGRTLAETVRRLNS